MSAFTMLAVVYSTLQSTPEFRSALRADARPGANVPDYVVENVRTTPDPVDPESSYVIGATVRNAGTGRATNRSYAELTIDDGDDGTWEYTGVLRIVASLPSGRTQSVTWANTSVPPPIDWEPQPGTVNRIRVCAAIPTQDPDFYLQETDDANNCSDKVVTIAGTAGETSSDSSSSSSTRITVISCRDVNPDWAREAIELLARFDIIRGYEDGRYGAADPVTRGQVATLIYRTLRYSGALAAPTNCEQYFDDVPQSHYAYTPLCALMKAGLVAEFVEFKPDAPATRAMTAVLLDDARQDPGASFGVSRGDLLANSPSYPDVPITDSAYESVAMMRATGLMTGYPDGRFGPKDTLNRAQAAIIMFRLLQNLDGTPLTGNTGASSSPANTTGQHAAAPANSEPDDAQPADPAAQEEWEDPAMPEEQEEPFEPEETENPAASLPDFTTAEVVVEPSAVITVLDTFTIRGLVYNDSPRGAAPSITTVMVDRDADGSYDTSGTAIRTPSIGAYGEAEATWTTEGDDPSLLWVPSVGMHRIRVCANNVVSFSPVPVTESNWQNNCAETTLQVLPIGAAGQQQNPPAQQAAALPDYYVESVVVSPNIVPQGAYSFSATIHNIGGAASVPTSATYAIDVGNDGTPDYWLSSDTAAKPVPALAAGASSTVTWSTTDNPLSVGWIATAGTHRVRVCVNMGPDFAEQDSAHNCSSNIFTVQAVQPAVQKPNFQVHVDSLAPKAGAAGTYIASGRTTNAGNVNAAASYTLMWMDYQSDTIADAASYKSTNALTPGQSHIFQWEVGSVPAGTHIFHMCADRSYIGSTTIAESNEADNCAEISFTAP